MGRYSLGSDFGERWTGAEASTGHGGDDRLAGVTMLDFWVLEAWGGDRGDRVVIARARDLVAPPPGSRLLVRRRASAFEVDAWLADPTSRERLLEIHASIRGCEPAAERAPWHEVDAWARRDLEQAFEIGELELLEEVAPPAGGGAVPRPTPQPTGPPTTPPLQPRPVPVLDDLWIRLELRPADATTCFDRLRVTSTDGAYDQQHVVATDHVPNVLTVDVEFTDLFVDKSYDVRVLPANGAARKVLSDVPYAALGGSRVRRPRRAALGREDARPEEVAGLDQSLGPSAPAGGATAVA